MTRGTTSSHLPAPSSTTAQLLNASFRKIVGHGPGTDYGNVGLNTVRHPRRQLLDKLGKI